MRPSTTIPINFSVDQPAWRPNVAPPASHGCSSLLQPPLAGLIFEMADVFYDASLWRRWLWQLSSRFGVRCDYHAFYESWDREFLVPAQCGRREMGEAFGAFLASHGFSWAQIDELEAACRPRRDELALDTRSFPGVAETLFALSAKGLRLAVLSDAVCPAERLQKQLAQLGIEGAFAAVLSSFDLEAATPDAGCYHAALDRLALRATQVAYVGHRCRGLGGATAVGLRTVAFNGEPTATGDVTITRFSELLGIVDRWGVDPGAANRPASAPRAAA
jgi:FMN phosphatase YigB (HAD superfamily)